MKNKITNNEKQKIKRIINSVITDTMLESFKCGAKDIAKSISQELNKFDFIDYYYLKGGNAFNRLHKNQKDTDWNFQVIPKENADFDTSIIEKLNEQKYFLNQYIVEEKELLIDINNDFINKFIIEKRSFNKRREDKNRLKKEIKNFRNLLIGEELKEDVNFYGDENNKTLNISVEEFILGFIPALIKIVLKEHLNIDVDVKYKENKSCQYLLGKDFLTKKLCEVYANEQFNSLNNCVTLSQEDITIDIFEDESYKEYFYPSVHVNYTIPEFILYRLCMNYCYEIVDIKNTKSENINLRMELLDISIPRKGSSLGLIAKKTDILEKDGFYVPGWRYHMFENIMLLSEANYGISGSFHKFEKRKNRADQSIKELLNLNSGSVHSLCWNEKVNDISSSGNISYLQQLVKDVSVENKSISSDEVKGIIQIKSDVDLSIDNSPSLYLSAAQRYFLNQINISEIITALKNILMQKYSITGIEEQTFNIYLDSICSSAYHISQSHKFIYPLAILSLKIDEKTFFEFSSKHMAKDENIKSIEVKDDVIEIKLNKRKKEKMQKVSTLIKISKIEDTKEYTSKIEESLHTKSAKHKFNTYLLDRNICINHIEELLNEIEIINIRKPLIDLYKQMHFMNT